MADIRDISTLPLARSSVDLLLKAGFRFVGDLRSVQPLELASELGVGTDVALSIIQCAESSLSVVNGPENKLEVTAKDILAKCGVTRSLITFCRQIDVMMGGGVPIGQITEFCGVPGVGKTQLGIQLALNVQIPEVFNGLGGEAIYIDTEGSFMVERVAEMASELSNHLHKLARGQATKNKSQDAIVSQISAAQSMTRDRFLEGIQIFRVHDQTETIATINHLSAYLKMHTKIRLVVIDSIAFHFRQDLSDTTARSRVLSSVAQTLNQLAYEHNLAIVVINHVTTRFERSATSRSLAAGGDVGGDGDVDLGDQAVPAGALGLLAGSIAVSGAQRLVPALGEQWSHCITNRVMLHWHQGRERRASLVKSPSLPFASVPYCVCERGIRDVPEELARDKKRRLEEQQQRMQQQNSGTAGATGVQGVRLPPPPAAAVVEAPPLLPHQDYHYARQQQVQYQQHLQNQHQQHQQQPQGRMQAPQAQPSARVPVLGPGQTQAPQQRVSASVAPPSSTVPPQPPQGAQSAPPPAGNPFAYKRA